MRRHGVGGRVLAIAGIAALFPIAFPAAAAMAGSSAALLEARRLVHDSLLPSDGVAWFYDGSRHGKISDVRIDQASMQISFTEISGFLAHSEGAATVTEPLRNLQVFHRDDSAYDDQLDFNGGKSGGGGGFDIDFQTDDRTQVDRIAAAFLTLSRWADAPPPIDSDPGFQKIVRDYRSAAVKPAIPEEGRMYKIQADDAISNKQFADAADLYGKALAIAPWWPEGHFNRALVLSEIGQFPAAIGEMQRYLALLPDAPDARTAQDKIYVWERKADQSNSGVKQVPEETK